MAQSNASTPKHIERALGHARACPKCSRFLFPIMAEIYSCCDFSFSAVNGVLQEVTRTLVPEKLIFKFSKNKLYVKNLLSKKEIISKQKFNLNDFEELNNYITTFMVLS